MKRRQGIVVQSVVLLLMCLCLDACRKDPPARLALKDHTGQQGPFKTKQVIIMVVDGARYSETWGDPAHRYIPDLAIQMAPEGIIADNYWNNGGTYTTAGYTAVSTGFYQEINNGGNQHPYHPGIFQLFRKSSGLPDSLVWIVTSKDKLQVLSDCDDFSWSGTYLPRNDCGKNGEGVGSGYRDDSLTFEKALQVLEQYHPKLMLIGFKEPDPTAHTGDWTGYLKQIKASYRYCRKIWDFLQTDSVYAGTTTVFITNDHGRHLDGVSNGFISHGDGCEGCRHILLFAAGPDFRKGLVSSMSCNMPDVAVTVGEVLGFKIPFSQGRVLTELFAE